MLVVNDVAERLMTSWIRHIWRINFWCHDSFQLHIYCS